MGQLPQLISETSELRKRSDFDVMTVSFDDPERQADVDRVIKEYKIKHTVVWDPIESTSLSNKADWNIKAFPTTMLINPQGNIQTSIDIDENLEENLLYFLDHQGTLAATGLSVTPMADAEGNVVPDENGAISVAVDLYSPDHAALDVMVDVTAIKMTYDEENDPEHTGQPEYVSIDYRETGMAPDFTASFDEFGNYYHEFQVADLDNVAYVMINVSVPIRGTEQLNGGEGLRTSAFRFVFFNR